MSSSQHNWTWPFLPPCKYNISSACQVCIKSFRVDPHNTGHGLIEGKVNISVVVDNIFRSSLYHPLALISTLTEHVPLMNFP
jgi:hypothetical protein